MIHLWKISRIGIGLIAFVLIWSVAVGFSSSQPGRFFNKANNAVWLEHAWVGDYKSEAEIQALLDDLRNYQFSTAFVHVGPLKSDGSIDPETYKYSIHFVDTVRKFDQDIQLQAWMGQLRHRIDLDDPEVRHNVVRKSVIMTQMVGFDGIHFDIEPAWDNDPGFIRLLKETREKLPEETVISVALAKFIPQSVLWLFGNIYEFKNYSTQVNYGNVQKYADQIAVMVYDTSISKKWLYKWLVKEQVIWITSFLDEADVFIGIPTYDYGDPRPWFDHEIENVRTGLEGIIKGLNNLRSNPDRFAGVAVYPYWEFDEENRKAYRELWLD